MTELVNKVTTAYKKDAANRFNFRIIMIASESTLFNLKNK